MKLPPNFNPGLIDRPDDVRDVHFSDFLPLGAEYVDWIKGYDVRELIGDLKIENQGFSKSCVAQAFSSYAQVLNIIEEHIFVDLSARDIYSHIYIPPSGGAYGYKGASYLVNRGVAQEKVVSSYEEGYKPPSETFMRIKDDSEGAILNASQRKAEGYAVIGRNDIEELAYAIEKNHGAVIGCIGQNGGWQSAFVTPPDGINREWGHLIYCIGFKIIRGKKHIIFQNSWGQGWGENGFGYLSEDYFNAGKVLSGYTIMDLPNQYLDQINMKRVVKLQDSPEQFIVESGRLYHIPDAETLNWLRELKIIIDGDPEIISPEEFNSLEMGVAVPSVKVNAQLQELYNVLHDAFGKQ